MEEELPSDEDEEVPFEVGLPVALLDGARAAILEYKTSGSGTGVEYLIRTSNDVEEWLDPRQFLAIETDDDEDLLAAVVDALGFGVETAILVKNTDYSWWRYILEFDHEDIVACVLYHDSHQPFEVAAPVAVKAMGLITISTMTS
eukprot:1471022-Prymnesium_polylepis.2